MIMKTALLIDGAFIRKKFRSALKKDITAQDIQAIVACSFNIFDIPPRKYRAYYYDCPPCSEKTSRPISHAGYNFEENPQYDKGIRLLKDVKLLPYFAVREGILSFNG
jgi:hypothetical protein